MPRRTPDPRTCPECGQNCAPAARRCPACGYDFTLGLGGALCVAALFALLAAVALALAFRR